MKPRKPTPPVKCPPPGATAVALSPPLREPRRHGDRGGQKTDDAATAADTWLSFADLKRAGLVHSWKVLREWQRDPRVAFPPGRLLAPNTRRWSKEHDVDPWLASRPVVREAFGDAEPATEEARP